MTSPLKETLRSAAAERRFLKPIEMPRLGKASSLLVFCQMVLLPDLRVSLMRCRESGYFAVLSKLVPLRASPMNDVLIGWPSNRSSLATKPARIELNSSVQQSAADDETESNSFRYGDGQINMPYRDLALTSEPVCQATTGADDSA